MLFFRHVYHYANFYLLYLYAVLTQLYLYATSLPSHLYAVFHAAQSLCHGSCNSITMPWVMLRGHCAVGKPHSHYAMRQWWVKIAPKFARRRPGGVLFIMLIRAELKILLANGLACRGGEVLRPRSHRPVRSRLRRGRRGTAPHAACTPASWERFCAEMLTKYINNVLCIDG